MKTILLVVFATWLVPVAALALSPDDPDRFLRLFNDLSPAFEESDSTVAAYYRAIDPDGEKTTIEDFKSVNEFDTSSPVRAVYQNDVDLGFGRNMYTWARTNGSIVSFVENYGDDSFDFSAGDTIEDAIDGPAAEIIENAIQGGAPASPKDGLIATVAMEYGPPPGNPAGMKYTRFYVYGADGARLGRVDLDGRGEKFVPGACNVCHGGNARPLADDSSYPFHGDTQAGFLPWDLETFQFSTTAEFTRIDQEEELRSFNEFVLQTEPTAAVRELVEGWYADPTPGDNLLPATAFDESFVPPGWDDDGPNENLYNVAIKPNCRVCHATRVNPIDQLRASSDVSELSDRISDLVFDRGVMPLAKRTYDKFWASVAPGSAADLLAAAVGRDASTDQPGGSNLVPFAGVESFAPFGLALPLDGTGTLYSDDPLTMYMWSVLSEPAGSAVAIADDTADRTEFTPTHEGVHEFQLAASILGTVGAPAKTRVITTASGQPDESAEFVPFSVPAAPPVPAEYFDPDVMAVMNSNCFSCHVAGDPSAAPNFKGDGSAAAVHTALTSMSRVDVGTPADSLLLKKPTEQVTHSGGPQLVIDDEQYTTLLAWITNGALNDVSPTPPPEPNVVDAITDGTCLSCHDGNTADAPNYLDARGLESDDDALFRNLAMRVDVQKPAESLLLLKATNAAGIDHVGATNVVWSDTDADYLLVLAWIEQGARRVHRPINDDIANAQLLVSSSGNVVATNIGATQETGLTPEGTVVAEPDHYDPGGKSLWWQFDGTRRGLLTIDTQASDFPTASAVYQGVGSLAALNPVALMAGDDGEIRFETGRDPVSVSIAVDGLDGFASPGDAYEGTVELQWSFDNEDSDGDGFPDYIEEAEGSDPNDSGSLPPPEVNLRSEDSPHVLNLNAAVDVEDDDDVQIATDGSGAWVAVWKSFEDLDGAGIGDSDIFVARSINRGRNWSAPALLNDYAVGDDRLDQDPQIATDGDGTWLAIWESTHDVGGIGNDRDIVISRSTDAGATWSTPVPLNANAATDSGEDADVQFATDGLGKWIAVWESSDSLGGSLPGGFSNIFTATSTDAGATWSMPVALNSNAATADGDSDDAQIATNGFGTWVVVWESNDSLGGTVGTDQDILFARSTDAGASWSPATLLNIKPGSIDAYDSDPEVVGVFNNWLVVWESDDSLGNTIGSDEDILYATSSDFGAIWTGPAALNSNAMTDSQTDSDPQVTTDGLGNWIAVWASREDEIDGVVVDTDYDVVSAYSRNNGLEWSDVTLVNRSGEFDSDLEDDRHPQLVTDGIGNWVASWRSDADTPVSTPIGNDYDILFATATGPDWDLDGLSDGEEVRLFNSHPVLWDTDGDGLSDGAEVNIHGTDPSKIDSNDNGVEDFLETGIANAAPIACGSTAGEIAVLTEVDFYRGEGDAGTNVEVDIDARENGSTLDPMIAIYDGAANLVTFNDDAAAPGEDPDTFDSYLSFQIPPGGVYYVAVTSHSDFDFNGSGAYTIGPYEIIGTCTAPPVPPVPAMSASGRAVLFGAILGLSLFGLRRRKRLN